VGARRQIARAETRLSDRVKWGELYGGIAWLATCPFLALADTRNGTSHRALDSFRPPRYTGTTIKTFPAPRWS
jgi:hypothetical protein